MQITNRSIYPELTKTADKIVQSSDLTYTLTCQQLVNGSAVLRSLAANTGFIAIVYEADAGTRLNAVTSFTEATTPGHISATTPPGTDGKLTIFVPGNWTYALRPGDYVVTLTMKTTSDTILLGRLWWTILSQAAS